MKKFEIFNNIEDKTIASFDADNDFIAFTKRIKIENEDDNINITTLEDAIEYINTFCFNLDLTIN